MTTTKADKPSLITKESGIQLGLVISMLVGAWMIFLSLESVHLAQQETSFAVERMGLEVHNKIDRVADNIEHNNELFESSLKLWISQLQADNPTLTVPDWGQSSKVR